MGLSNEIKTSLLQAMDIIATKAVSEVGFDSTIKCIIVNNDHSEDGYYTVANGNTKFTAYAENTMYKVDECVRVTIPNNDYMEKKYIIGKWAGDDGTEPITYTSAANTILEVVTFVNNEDLSIGIEANGTKKSKSILLPDLNSFFEEISDNEIFNTLFIETNFETHLNTLKMTGGKYGVHLSIFNKNSQPINSLVLDSTEFFGNPYAFKIPVKQSKKLNLTNFDEIGSISLEIFQNDDFYYYDNNEIYKLDPVGMDNIFIKGLKIGIGTDLSFVEDNTVKLFCQEGLNYDKNENSLSKEISLLWYNKTKDNTYLGFSDGIAEKDGQSARYYDENYYLDQQEEDNRLKSQMVEGVPTDRASLDLRSKINSIVIPTVKEIYTVVAKDLPELLGNFNTRLGTSFPEISEKISDAYDEVSENKAEYETDILQLMRDFYSTKSYKKGDIISSSEYDTIKFIEAINKEKKLIWYNTNTEYPEGVTPDVDLNLYFGIKYKEDGVEDAEQKDYVVKKNIRAKLLKTLKVNLIEQQFIDIFNFGAECQAYDNNLNQGQVVPFFESFNYYSTNGFIVASTVSDKLQDFIDIIIELRSNISKQVKSNYKSFNGVWNGWEPKFDYIQKKLKNYQDIINESLPSSINRNLTQKTININNGAIIYTATGRWGNGFWESSFDPEKDSNLYSIYWYKYCPSWNVKGNTTLTDNEILSQAEVLPKNTIDYFGKKVKETFNKNALVNEDKIIFADWKRINISGPTWNNNVGLPSPHMTDKNIVYWNKNSSGENLPKFTIKLDPDATEEKFKAVIVFNHNRYESDEIIFTNVDNMVNLNLSDKDKSDFEIANGEKSRDNYQDLYNFTNEIILSSEASVDRTVFAQFKNASKNNEDVFKNSWIYWYIPEGSTMLKYNIDDLEAKKFFSDKEKTVKSKKNTSYYAYKMTPEGDRSFTNNRVIVKGTKDINGVTYACINANESQYIKQNNINFDTYKGKKIYYAKTADAVFYKEEENIPVTFSAGLRFKSSTLSLYKNLNFGNKGKSFEDLTKLSADSRKYIYAYEYLKKKDSQQKDYIKNFFGSNTSDMNSVLENKTFSSSNFETYRKKYQEVSPYSEDYANFEKDVITRANSSTDKYVDKEESDGTIYYIPSIDIEATYTGLVKTSNTLDSIGDALLIEDKEDNIKEYIYLQENSEGGSKTHQTIKVYAEEKSYINGIELDSEKLYINILDIKAGNTNHSVGSIKTVSGESSIDNQKTGKSKLYIYKLMADETNTVSKNSLVMTRSEFYDPITKQKYYKNSTGFLLMNDFSYEKPFYSKDGYFCFYKKIDSNYKDIVEGKCTNCGKTSSKCECMERENAIQENKKFYYQIKDMFSQDATNNSIMCAIEGERWTAEETLTTKTFTFGTYGANGTEYSIRLTPSRKKVSEEIKDEEGNGTGKEVSRLITTLKVNLYNGTGEEEDFSEPITSWIGPTSCLIEKVEKDHDGKGYVITIKDRIGDKITEKKSFDLNTYHALLKLEIGLETVDLETIYAIPYANSEAYYINGATQVIYDTFGTSSSFCSEPYAIFQNNNNSIDQIEGVSWSIKSIKGDPGGVGSVLSNDDPLQDYMPTLTDKKNDGNITLNPINTFVDNAGCYPVVVCSKGSDILWIQPIAILQNRFGSATLNKWDGKFKINEDEGTILSSMVGAGKKNRDNSFSGVLMGDVNDKAGFSPNTVNTGLYGFHEGSASFGFDVNGTAFLGKSGKGRIVFNGNSGLIHSAKWDGVASADGSILTLGTKGMCIDLENGHIDAHNFKLTSDHISLNSNPVYGGEWLNIGNDQTYMKFTSDGALKIKVTEFELTYHTGENLLRNTAPLENQGEYLSYDEVWVTDGEKQANNKDMIYVTKVTTQEDGTKKEEDVLSYIKYNRGKILDANTFASIVLIKSARAVSDYENLYKAYDEINNNKKHTILKYLNKDNVFVDFETFYKVQSQLSEDDYNKTNIWVRSVLSNTYETSKSIQDYLALGGGDADKYYATIGFFTAPKLSNSTSIITKTTFDKYFEMTDDGKFKCKKDIWVRNQAKIDLIDEAPDEIKTFIAKAFKTSSSKRKCIQIEDNTFSFYQMLKNSLDASKNYTLSGKVFANTTNTAHTITFQVGGEVQTLKLKNKSGWYDIDFKFKNIGQYIDGQSPNLSLFKIDGIANHEKSDDYPYTLFYQLKLEEGLTATQWNQSTSEEIYADKISEDEGNAAEDFSKGLDAALNTNAIFNRLTNNGQKQGFFNEGDKFFINAECIGTGLLRSNEVDGTFSYTYKGLSNEKKISLSSYETVVASMKEEKKEDFTITNINLTKGTIFDLRSGFIAANRFEVNSWKEDSVKGDHGLYLNSTPYSIVNNQFNTTLLQTKISGGNYDRYYFLRLGNLKSAYISFDGFGALNMRVNKFELTSVFGGTNLLNDTGPLGPLDSKIRNFTTDTDRDGNVDPYAHWGYNAEKISAYAKDTKERGKSIRIHNHKALTGNCRKIYQYIPMNSITSNNDYTLSGWINIPEISGWSSLSDEDKPKICFVLKPYEGATDANSIIYSHTPSTTGWQYFYYIFNVSEKSSFQKRYGEDGKLINEPRYFEIRDYYITTEFDGDKAKEDKENYTWFNQLKLEQGTVATQWEESEQDKKDKLGIYDTEFLLQDEVFDKLTNRGKSKGIFLDGEQLFFNADYISTGILRSTNWKGTYKYTYKDDKGETVTQNLNQNQLTNYLINHPDGEISDITASEGMYIDLDNGKIWTDTLTLKAGTVNTTDFLGLYSVDQGSNITINGEAAKTWRIIAGKKFGVKSDGTLYASGVTVTGNISATSGTIAGFEIAGSENPSNGFWNYSLSNVNSKKETGDDGKEHTVYYVTFLRGTNTTSNIAFGIKKTITYNFDSNKPTSTDWSDNTKTAYTFSVSNEGELTATAGNIAGWKIASNRLHKTIYDKATSAESSKRYSAYVRVGSNANVTTKVFGIYYENKKDDGNWGANQDIFYVDNTGYLFAKSGKIAGWTLSSSKLTAGGNDTGVLPVVVQAPTSTTSTVFAVGGKADHSNYQDSTTRKFYVRADGYIYASSGTIGGWTINASSITSADGTTTLSPSRSKADGGSISGAYISGGTVNGATITGGSIDIGNATYYLEMGQGTAHPSVSGLNVGAGGISMNGVNGISSCPSIGGSKGQINFTSAGVEIDTYFSIAGSSYMYVPSTSNAKRTLGDYVNEVAALYSPSGITGVYNFETTGGTGFYQCTFTDGVLTKVASSTSVS